MAPGDALHSFSNTFPHFTLEERQSLFSVAFERFCKVHEVSEPHRTVLCAEKDVKVFNAGASTIDSEINDARALASEVKRKYSTGESFGLSGSIWKLRQMAEAKVAVISRIRSLMIANSFEYASHVEKALSTAHLATIYGEVLWRDLLLFVRNISPDAEIQLTQTYELFSSPNKEKRTHALTSLRRLLVTLADALSPAKSLPGLESEKYLNRLSKFVEDKLSSVSAHEIDPKEMERRLRKLNEWSSKAVHAEVSVFEARRCLLSLQLYLSELDHITAFGQQA